MVRQLPAGSIKNFHQLTKSFVVRFVINTKVPKGVGSFLTLRRTIDAYINDIVVKIKEEPDHISDLIKAFTILRRHKLKLNTMKCVFGVS